MFLTGFSFVHTHAPHRFWLSVSPFSFGQPFTVPGCTSHVSWKAQLRVPLPPRAVMKVSHRTRGIPTMELLFHVQIGGTLEPFVDEIDLASIALSFLFVLDLLSACDTTKSPLPD